ncbi:hypothetical protein EAO71_06055 [Streptomyces sp. ms191]|nr:hypothetical protein EAO71_06055 [Streptomyces sp. ms191]
MIPLSVYDVSRYDAFRRTGQLPLVAGRLFMVSWALRAGGEAADERPVPARNSATAPWTFRPRGAREVERRSERGPVS